MPAKKSGGGGGAEAAAAKPKETKGTLYLFEFILMKLMNRKFLLLNTEFVAG